ncbi:MAG: pyridoxal phosphate-dependent aminotransferase [Bacteroidetes bacterium]|nr:pyridoxal phosphate-dependent aminotransferase [Bacteroidota bacterium]
MEIKRSGASLSRIVLIGEKLKKISLKEKVDYLLLNRGVNSVVNINLKDVVKNIDFNSTDIQVYPAGAGVPALREAINVEYFNSTSKASNILITAGGMNALDLIVQTVDMDYLFLPTYYWGCYFQMLKVRKVGNKEYSSQSELYDMIDELRGNAVLICDPGNPLGEKYDDEEQFKLIKTLSDNNVTVFFDSPYRRIFYNSKDDYYSRLMELKNVVITESFSKSVGLSGQRLGFIHSTNKELIDELAIRLMYCTNGVNAFAQHVVLSLLTTPEGVKASNDFKKATANDIFLNIKYLQKRGFLVEKYYNTSVPKGIFAVVNFTEEELLKYYIGSVSLSFFTKTQKEEASNYARICVSSPHERFVSYFDAIK